MNLQLILDELTNQEKKDMLILLKKELVKTPQLVKVRPQINESQKTYCPHCKSGAIYGHGIYKGRKRYRCKQCRKTFNDYTGTAISGVKKVDKFQEYIDLMLESVSIRKAAKQLNISANTIFDWRHKIASVLSVVSINSFYEIDAKYLS